jgi:hypothetical protein
MTGHRCRLEAGVITHHGEALPRKWHTERTGQPVREQMGMTT